MASFIPFVDCCEAVIQFLLDTIPGVITLGFKHTVSGAYGVADLGDLATAISTHLVTPLAAVQSGQIHYTNIHLRDLDTVSGAVFDQPLTQVGGVSGGSLPNQVAMTVTFLTGVAGRSFRGRNFIPALPIADTASDRTWSASIIASMTTIYENFDVSLPAVDSSHVVLSRFSGGAPRLTGIATDVIGYRANVGVYTQRRRLT